MSAIEDLTAPLLASPKHAAKLLGLTDAQIRTLMRERRIAYVCVGRRRMVPREALQQFILDNTVRPCRDTIPAPTSVSTTNAAAITSPRPSAAARGSAARALQIANKLKSHLPSSSTSGPAALAPVIPLKR